MKKRGMRLLWVFLMVIFLCACSGGQAEEKGAPQEGSSTAQTESGKNEKPGSNGDAQGSGQMEIDGSDKKEPSGDIVTDNVPMLVIYTQKNVCVFEYTNELVGKFFEALDGAKDGSMELVLDLDYKFQIGVMQNDNAPEKVEAYYWNGVNIEGGQYVGDKSPSDCFEVGYEREGEKLTLFVKGNTPDLTQGELPGVDVIYTNDAEGIYGDRNRIPKKEMSMYDSAPEKFTQPQQIWENTLSESVFKVFSCLPVATDDYLIMSSPGCVDHSCEVYVFDEQGNVVQELHAYTAEGGTAYPEEGVYGTSNPNVFYDVTNNSVGGKYYHMKYCQGYVYEEGSPATMVYMSKPYMTLENYTNMKD